MIQKKTKKEKDNITVLCTKLKLYPLGDKDEVNRVYKYIRDGQYAQYRTANLLMVNMLVLIIKHIFLYQMN